MRVAAVLVVLIGCASARADDALDSIMYHSPELPYPVGKTEFPPGLAAAWADALRRPEVDPRTEAARAIARAHRLGLTGLSSLVPALNTEATRSDTHPTARLAAVEALIALDAKESATALFELAKGGNTDLAEVIEPALARWNHAPARDEWLTRLNRMPLDRGTVRAARGLATVADGRAVSKLRELTLAAETAPAIRLELATALGRIRTSGGEADADQLTPTGPIGKVAAAHLLRQHSGPETIRRLQAAVRDTEPSAAALAAARLLEIDPALMEPVLTPALASPDANVRMLAVEALARRPSADHVTLLADRLSDPHPDVRNRARRVLRDHSEKANLRDSVIPRGERVLNGSDWRGKEQAAILLAHLDHKPAAKRLVGLLSDPRPEVGVAAGWGLRVLAVPDTLPACVDHFRQHTRPGRVGAPPIGQDERLSHVAQLFGQQRHTPADAALRTVVPFGAPAGVQTRAAGIWALGLILENKTDPPLAAELIGRLDAVLAPNVEPDLVRRMSAVSLARMTAPNAVPALRRHRISAVPDLNMASNACGWALNRVAGDPWPPPGTIPVRPLDWFLLPIEK